MLLPTNLQYLFAEIQIMLSQPPIFDALTTSHPTYMGQYHFSNLTPTNLEGNDAGLVAQLWNRSR